MKIGPDGRFHLAYCTKIHPANGWHDLSEAVREYVPALKKRLSPDRPFGVALRLSDAESAELLGPHQVEAFKEFLAQNDLYVFTVNGFPFGSFYGLPVKSDIFAPDWQDERRVRYTLRLVEILRQLLPPGTEGSISTLPLSYRSWVANKGQEKAMERIEENLIRLVEALVRVRREHGIVIHLDIEPEPDGLVETVRDFVEYYRDRLQRLGAPLLATRIGASLSEASRYLRDHIRLCLDTCHMAVMYEDPAEILQLLAKEDIGIGKVQITSGLKVRFPKERQLRAGLSPCLERFAESEYLHQVIGRRAGGSAGRFPDLCLALPHLEGCRDDEWRIHYHMPLFVGRYRMMESTQAETLEVLRLLSEKGFTEHLEIETYTWEQLPGDIKIDLFDSLLKEYHWVLDALPAS